ncbi:CoA transferase [Nonomuraea sp. NPDC050310]|uniref:CoA transferase n=1 Tax=Nonomuraea sp. NPDC050310 TaxID=3154935 RepID=UPI0033DFEC27
MERLVEALAAEVGVRLPTVRITDDGARLASALPVEVLAAVSVGVATGAAAAIARESAEVDVREALAAFLDERYFLIDGVAPELWAPLSGDYRTVDGWVRLHSNFDHHREAVVEALGLMGGVERAEVEVACGSRTAIEVEEAVTAAGGCAAAQRSRAEWAAHPQAVAVAAMPLVGLERVAAAGGTASGGSASPRSASRGSVSRASASDGSASGGSASGGSASGGSASGGSASGGSASGGSASTGSASTGSAFSGTAFSGLSSGGWRAGCGGGRPLEGVRVLDLTRVIAGPVASRTLAAYGAKVLRVGAAHLPEVPGLVVSTAFGKRSTELDLRTGEGAEAFRRLVSSADIVVRGYRPGGLEWLGFGFEELARIRPGVVCVDISAYGRHGPWGGWRGFDSLVQMVTGIAGGSPPRPLPAQALDHATGYLAAFGAMAALLRRAEEGGSWRVEVALARVAQWLVELGDAHGEGDRGGEGGRRGEGGGRFDVEGLLGEMDSSFGRLTYVLAPGRIGGRRPGWETPPPARGEHPPEWW